MIKKGLHYIIIIAIIFTFYYKNFYYSLVKLPCKNCIIQDKDTNCGPIALKMVLNDFNIKIDLNEIENITKYDKNFGVSMYNLYQCCEELCINSKAFKMDISSLEPTKSPSILFVKNSHFIVLDSINKEKEFYIRDPKKGRYMLKKKFINKICSGEILIINNK